MLKKLHTEQEHLENNRFQAFRLARLFLKDRRQFEDVCLHLPVPLGLHDRSSLDLVFSNNTFGSLIGFSPEEIVQGGLPLIKSISDLDLLHHSVSLIRKFEMQEDYNSVCSYFQRMRIKGKMALTYTHKVLINEDKDFTIMYKCDDIGFPGKFVEKLVDEIVVDKNGWVRFQSLSKREKEILKLIASGLTTKQIGDKLLYLTLP